MRYLFFIGTAHHKIHTRFLHALLGGEQLYHECANDETNFPDRILAQDGEDAVWLFPDLYPHLHARLKGKQIFTGHGLNFPPWLNPVRAACINDHIDMVFENGLTQENDYKRLGVNLSKIRPVGSTILFEIPDIPSQKNAVLFSSTYFAAWNHDDNLRKILENLDEEIAGRVAIHPSAPAPLRRSYEEICAHKKNLRYIRSQEELLDAYAVCSYNVNGGSSSVCAAFWYQKKPVILVRGPWARNPARIFNWDGLFKKNGKPFYRGMGWTRMKTDIHEPVFDEILEQSHKISSWKQFRWDKIRSLGPVPAADKIFYPWNYDREETAKKIFQCLKELEK